MTLRPAINDLEDFHRITDTPVCLVPEWPADERIDLRVELIVEEVVRELLTAIARRDMVGTSNGIVDGIYVLIGAAHEFGIPIEVEWDAVHLSNMQKAVEQPDGTLKVIRRPDGKILKPEGWKPPDTEGILRAHGWKGPAR
jgi:predicted HAD superfamily Cof-like phosphohydrolase